VVSESYIPQRGDIVWVDFSPSIGHEQAGRRPAVVLSSRSYNEPSSLALVCPLTRSVKGYAFEVPIPPGLSVRGVVLADHIRSIDWKTRKVEFMGRRPGSVIEAIWRTLAKVIA
jgi:mRNA interferase MazF